MSEQQRSPDYDAGIASCGHPYAEPPDEPIQPGDYHYFNGLEHCACGRWVRPDEHVLPPVVIDITGGPLSPEERAIHAKYQSDDPAADYYDTTVLPPAERSES